MERSGGSSAGCLATLRRQSPYLKSGRVNFILPCSVAIFSARGTASSHLDRTHSLSHLHGEQPISTCFTVRSRGLSTTGLDSPEADL